MVIISGLLRRYATESPRQLYMYLLRECRKLPRGPQEYYKHSVKQVRNIWPLHFSVPVQYLFTRRTSERSSGSHNPTFQYFTHSGKSDSIGDTSATLESLTQSKKFHRVSSSTPTSQTQNVSGRL